MTSVSAATVREALATVMDPEIPACAITDLGMVEDVRISTGGDIEIDLLPTYSGCPALDVIREDVVRAVAVVAPDATIDVRFVNAPPWTSDRVNDAARAAMGGIGISAPLLQIGRGPGPCPYCGSNETRLDSAFGPTPCRTIAYCAACRNPFEGFKAKVPRGRA